MTAANDTCIKLHKKQTESAHGLPEISLTARTSCIVKYNASLIPFKHFTPASYLTGTGANNLVRIHVSSSYFYRRALTYSSQLVFHYSLTSAPSIKTVIDACIDAQS